MSGGLGGFDLGGLCHGDFALGYSVRGFMLRGL